MSHHTRRSAWYRALWTSFRQLRKKRRGHSPAFRLRIELLESRALLSAVWGSEGLADNLLQSQVTASLPVVGPLPSIAAVVTVTQGELRHSPVSQLHDVTKMIVAGDPPDSHSSLGSAQQVGGGARTSVDEPTIELKGTVSCNNKTHNVVIRPSASNGIIQDNVSTWIVIHGRNSSPSSSNLVQLATALDGYSPSDQVLVLDWSSAAASGLLGGAGENCIKPVAAWASTTLTVNGLSPDELNLVGHSWGAYVAAELAELQPNALVNSIVALDPAIDYWGGNYNPTAKNEVNFARNSNFSWAFYAYGGSFGSATTASTADEAFVVKSTDHSKLVNVFARLVTITTTHPTTTGIDEQFNTSAGELRLLVGVQNTTWKPNSYSSSGKRSASGTFEAVITATSDKLGVLSLEFINKTNGTRVILSA